MKQKIMIGCLATLLTAFTNSTNATVPSCRENQKEKVESTFVKSMGESVWPSSTFTWYTKGYKIVVTQWRDGDTICTTITTYNTEYGTQVLSLTMCASLKPTELSGFVIDESTIKYSFDSDEDEEFFYSLDLEKELIDQVNAHLEDLD